MDLKLKLEIGPKAGNFLSGQRERGRRGERENEIERRYREVP
jgi:hypothetical protein